MLPLRSLQRGLRIRCSKIDQGQLLYRSGLLHEMQGLLQRMPHSAVKVEKQKKSDAKTGGYMSETPNKDEAPRKI